jgi:hypothetical protein
MKAIIQKTVEVIERRDASGRYAGISSRITVIRFLSIPIYRKEESFSD